MFYANKCFSETHWPLLMLITNTMSVTVCDRHSPKHLCHLTTSLTPHRHLEPKTIVQFDGLKGRLTGDSFLLSGCFHSIKGNSISVTLDSLNLYSLFSKGDGATYLTGQFGKNKLDTHGHPLPFPSWK